MKKRIFMLSILILCVCLYLTVFVYDEKLENSSPDSRLTIGELIGMVSPGVSAVSADFPDDTAPVTRAEAAHIFASCLPEAEPVHINAVFGISDVHSSRNLPVPYSEDIFLLCRAGILTVDTETYRFHPDDLITQGEAEEIITRLADPSARQRYEILPTNGIGYSFSDYSITVQDGKSLSLGYHTMEEFQAFLGDAVPVKETVSDHGSIDYSFDENGSYFAYEEGKIVRAEYEDYSITYLIADRDPLGVFVWVLCGNSGSVSDMRGVSVGCTREEVEALYPDHDIHYMDETDAIGSFATEAFFNTSFAHPSGEQIYVTYTVNPDTGKVTSTSLHCPISG